MPQLVDFRGWKVSPGMADALTRFEAAFNVKVPITSAYRSVAEQQQLYSEFQRGTRSGPVAFPGRSNHQTGDAVDVAVGPVRNLMIERGAEFGLYHLKGDPPHFDVGVKPATSPQLYDSKTTGAAPAGVTAGPVAEAVPVGWLGDKVAEPLVALFSYWVGPVALVVLGGVLIVVAFREPIAKVTAPVANAVKVAADVAV